MKFRLPVVLVLFFGLLCSIYACSSEPANTGECIDRYMQGVENDKAAEAIEQACREIFDANKADDKYYECILKDMPGAKTDKDVNIVIRRCTMDK